MTKNDALKLAIQCMRDKSAALEFNYTRRSLAMQKQLEEAEQVLLGLKDKPEPTIVCLTLPLPEA